MLSAEHAQQSLQLFAQHNDPDLFTNMSKRRLATVSLCRILVKLGEQRARLIGFVTSRVSPEQIQRGPSKTTKILAAKSDKRTPPRTTQAMWFQLSHFSHTNLKAQLSRLRCSSKRSHRLRGSAWRFWTAENSSRCSNDENVVTRLKFYEGDDMYFATTNDAGVFGTAIAGTTTHSVVDALKDLIFRPASSLFIVLLDQLVASVRDSDVFLEAVGGNAAKVFPTTLQHEHSRPTV